jgi:hypothetical protein
MADLERCSVVNVYVPGYGERLTKVRDGLQSVGRGRMSKPGVSCMLTECSLIAMSMCALIVGATFGVSSIALADAILVSGRQADSVPE